MIRILCKDTYLSEKWKVKSEKKEAANKEPLFYRNDIFLGIRSQFLMTFHS